MRTFLTGEWRDLAMLNYAVDPAMLQPFVPRGTELDTFDGRAFVSLVGFRFVNTRVLGVPVPGHRTFEEVNLRIYVRRETHHEVRRAVTFIRELVPRPMIATVARLTYNEPYRSAPMRHVLTGGGADVSSRSAEYAWRLGPDWAGLRVDAVHPGVHDAHHGLRDLSVSVVRDAGGCRSSRPRPELEADGPFRSGWPALSPGGRHLAGGCPRAGLDRRSAPE